MLGGWPSEPWTLRSHLLAYGAAITLPALLFCGLLLFRAAVLERRQIERDTVDVVRGVAADIDSDLSAMTTTLRALATSPALARGDLAMFERQMRAAIEPGSFDLILADTNGQQLVNTRAPMGEPLPKLASQDWRNATREGKVSISNMAIGAVARQYILSITIPVVQDGEPRYALMAAFLPTRVHDILQRQSLKREWTIGVSDRLGRIIARSTLNERFAGEMLREDLRRGADQHNEAAVWRTTNLLGEPVLRTTIRSKVSGWLVAATVPLEVANGPLYDSWRSLGALGATFLLLSGLLAHLFGRRAAAPISALADTARHLGQGQPVAQLHSLVREVNEVAGAMSAAARELQARTEALAESRARLGSIVDSAMDAIISVDERQTILLFNTAAERLFNCPAPEAIGTDVERFLPKHLRESHRAHVAAFAQSREVQRQMGGPRQVMGVRRDGREFPIEAAISQVQVGGQRLFTVILRDISDRVRAEKERRASEDRLRRVIDNLFAFVGLLSLEGTLIEANKAPLEAAGLTREDVIGRRFWDCPWWTWSPDVVSRLRLAIAEAAAGETVRYDAEIMVKHGQHVIIDFQIAPLRDAEGQITHLVPSGIDITERKQREEHIHLLMREITHRSKNLLAVIQAMARQSRIGSRTVQEFESRFSARLQALAASHDLLVQRNWHGVSLADMVRSQLGHLVDQRASRIKIDGPYVVVAPEAAQNIGMALHELSTNAAKYGALSVSQGRVEVSWCVGVAGSDGPEGAGANGGDLEITWVERGGPRVEPPASKGFGHVVMEHVAARALNGHSTLTFAPDGVRWSLVVPATHIIADLHAVAMGKDRSTVPVTRRQTPASQA